ncbi:hypothetical protein V8C35DRAFT_36790 [Trichoderma chlorosporum]
MPLAPISARRVGKRFEPTTHQVCAVSARRIRRSQRQSVSPLFGGCCRVARCETRDTKYVYAWTDRDDCIGGCWILRRLITNRAAGRQFRPQASAIDSPPRISRVCRCLHHDGRISDGDRVCTARDAGNTTVSRLAVFPLRMPFPAGRFDHTPLLTLTEDDVLRQNWVHTPPAYSIARLQVPPRPAKRFGSRPLFTLMNCFLAWAKSYDWAKNPDWAILCEEGWLISVIECHFLIAVLVVQIDPCPAQLMSRWLRYHTPGPLWRSAADNPFSD